MDDLGAPPCQENLHVSAWKKNMIQHDLTMYTKQHASNGRCHCTLQHHVVAQEAQMRCIHLHPSNRTTHCSKSKKSTVHPSGTTHLANIIHPHTSTKSISLDIYRILQICFSWVFFPFTDAFLRKKWDLLDGTACFLEDRRQTFQGLGREEPLRFRREWRTVVSSHPLLKWDHPNCLVENDGK